MSCRPACHLMNDIILLVTSIKPQASRSFPTRSPRPAGEQSGNVCPPDYVHNVVDTFSQEACRWGSGIPTKKTPRGLLGTSLLVCRSRQTSKINIYIYIYLKERKKKKKGILAPCPSHRTACYTAWKRRHHHLVLEILRKQLAQPVAAPTVFDSLATSDRGKCAVMSKVNRPTTL